jgi:hypothetical protein
LSAAGPRRSRCSSGGGPRRKAPCETRH